MAHLGVMAESSMSVALLSAAGSIVGVKALACALLLANIWCGGRLASAEAASQPPESFDLTRIDSYVAEQVRERGLVGLSVAIVKNGEVVLAKGYGKSALRESRAVTPGTMFAVGSVTKQLT